MTINASLDNNETSFINKTNQVENNNNKKNHSMCALYILNELLSKTFFGHGEFIFFTTASELYTTLRPAAHNPGAVLTAVSACRLTAVSVGTRDVSSPPCRFHRAEIYIGV